MLALPSLRLLGWTALTFASVLGHAEVAEVLIQAGADVNSSDIQVSLQYHHSSSSCIKSLQASNSKVHGTPDWQVPKPDLFGM